MNLKKANLKELKKTLQNLPWATAMLDNDVNTNLINWEDLFWTAVNEFVPQKRINDKFTPPWIDKEVKVSFAEGKIEPAERRCEQRVIEI